MFLNRSPPPRRVRAASIIQRERERWGGPASIIPLGSVERTIILSHLYADTGSFYRSENSQIHEKTVKVGSSLIVASPDMYIQGYAVRGSVFYSTIAARGGGKVPSPSNMYDFPSNM